MATIGTLPLKISELAKEAALNVEIKVTGLRWFRFRLWCGRQLLKLAARVIGCNIVIETGTE